MFSTESEAKLKNKDETNEDPFKTFYTQTIQSKSNLKRCRQYINDLFISTGGEKMKFVERRLYQIGHNLQFSREIHFLADQSYSFKHENFVNFLNNKLKDSEWNDHELMRYFKAECEIQVGQKLDSLPDLEKLQGDKAIRNYVFEEGRIFIIYMWTIYKSICKKQLKLLNDLYERHLDWEGNVKMVSINTDLNRDIAKKTIKSLQLSRIEHLYIDSNKYPNHPLFNLANKYGYPVCVLINNDSLIDLCGSLYEIDLEKKIKLMINRDNVSTTSFYPNNASMSDTEKRSLKNIVKALETSCDSLRSSLQAPHLCGATMKTKKIYSANANNNFMHTPAVKSPKEKETSNALNTLLNAKDSNGNISANNIISSFSSLLRQATLNMKKEKSPSRLKSISKNNILSLFKDDKYSKPTYQIFCELEYFCHPLDEKVFEDVFQGVDQIRRTTITKNFVETFELPYAELNAICSHCHKEVLCFSYFHEREKNDLSNNASAFNLNESGISFDDVIVNNQFYCPICKIHLCKNCGDELTDINLSENIHNHFLYYLTANTKYFQKFILAYNYDNNYEFDFKYFQENKRTDHFIQDMKYHYQVKCDGCLEFPVRTVRWKCCNCLYRNLCDNCKSSVENRVYPQFDSIIYNLERSGCDPLHHVFMKIIFDSFVY